MGELLTWLSWAAAALVLAGLIYAICRSLIRPPEPVHPQHPWHRVVHVRDGDTLEVDMDGVTVPVRVIGIDTPETVHPDRPVEWYGPEASAEAHRLLDGQWVQITMDLHRRQHVDAYGRLVAYVTLPTGADYGWHMLATGYARENTFAGQPYQAQADYRHAESLARGAGTGMWSRAPRW